MLIQLPVDAASALPNGVHVGEDAVYVTEKKVHATTDRSELLITWVVAHTVFQFKFKKEQTTMGVIVFNRVCGFSTKDPPRVGKVMKALK